MTDKKNAPKGNITLLINKVYQKKLVNSNRFVCYKSDKTPYNAETKIKADCTNPVNFRSFKYAVNSVKNTPDFEGIGFVLGKAENINYCGLDIDDCIINGVISPEVLEIIELLDTYTEISRSGKGIHLIFQAEKKGLVCKNKDLKFCKCLELYDTGRYFALTGNIIRNKDIESRQEQCNLLYDKYFKHKELMPIPEKIPDNIQQINEYFEMYGDLSKKYGQEYLNFILENDKKFKELWHREITITDESSTDQSFFNKLAYWLKYTPELIKLWFYKSPYFEGKDTKHKKKALRPDYINRSISKAISFSRSMGVSQ